MRKTDDIITIPTIDETFIVAEEYYDKNNEPYDSHIIFDTDNEDEADEFAKNHNIIGDNNAVKTIVSVWVMEDDRILESYPVKSN